MNPMKYEDATLILPAIQAGQSIIVGDVSGEGEQGTNFLKLGEPDTASLEVSWWNVKLIDGSKVYTRRFVTNADSTHFVAYSDQFTAAAVIDSEGVKIGPNPDGSNPWLKLNATGAVFSVKVTAPDLDTTP